MEGLVWRSISLDFLDFRKKYFWIWLSDFWTRYSNLLIYDKIDMSQINEQTNEQQQKI